MTLQPIFFEEKERYYTADKSFQEQIPDAAAADLVVSVFWSRLGSELPPDLDRLRSSLNAAAGGSGASG